MGELTRDDIGRAVHDALHDITNEMARIKDTINRVDQRTNDLDESQREITTLTRTMQQVVPKLDVLTRRAEQGPSEMQDHQRTQTDVEDIKLRVQNIERGMLQLVNYLQARDKVAQDEQNFRKGMQ